VQVSDIWVEANSIAISTHGRSFYVLDDVAALRQHGQETAGDFYLYKPGAAIRGAGAASIPYVLNTQPAKLTLEILDAKGAVIQTLNGAAGRGAGRGRGAQGAQGTGRADLSGPPSAAGATPGTPDDAQQAGRGGGRGRGGFAPTAPMNAGLNRASWNLDYPGAVTFPGMILWGATTNGPMALPGTYQVRLTVDGRSQTQPLVIRKHPLRDTPDADLQQQFALALQIRDKVSEANNAVIHIRRLKDDVKDRLSKSPDPQLKAAGDRLTERLSSVEQDIYQVKNQSNQDPLNFPIKTNNRLASLLGMTLRGEGKPTANIYPIFEDLKKELKSETDRLEEVLSADLAAFNQVAQKAGVPPVNK
jgi:hypothetical protein